MKKLLTILLGLTLSSAFAQTTIYSENFGAGAGAGAGNPLAGDYTGYSNSNASYSGTADIRVSTPSTNYPNASGNGCVFLGATTATPEKMLLIEGINSTGYDNIALSLGHQKGTNAGSNELKIEVSSDGTNWTELTYTRPTGSNTSNWILVTPTGTIPETTNLRIKFTNVLNSNVGFRIDDLTLTGISNLSITDENNVAFKIYPTIVSDGVFTITSKLSDMQKKVTIFDVKGSKVLDTMVDEQVNVSKLSSGTYFVKIQQNGLTHNSKIIIK